MKHILIVHTGGTFGMEVNTQHTLHTTHAETLLGQLFNNVPELKKLDTKLDMEVLWNLDSSDVGAKQWVSLAKKLHASWDHFDGFVVIHGTDTMAYSASAVSFLLGRRNKPVVFTGSQLPLSALRTDAKANLLDSVQLATCETNEVMICFDAKIHKGCWATKDSNEHLQAFRSPNSPILGSVGVHLTLNQSVINHDFSNPPWLFDDRINANVLAMSVCPSSPLPKTVRSVLLNTYDGLILRVFGKGTVPNQDGNDWSQLSKEALEKQIPLLITSQCSQGGIDLHFYENSKIFLESGAISAQSLTFEASCVKMMIGLGRDVPFSEFSQFMSLNLVGERQEILS